MERKININLLIRMYQDHGYTVEDIWLRLNYPHQAVQAVIEYHKLKHGKSHYN